MEAMDHREHFEALFAESNDPWGFKTRWYEARKRALTLAALPAAHYLSGYEPGCANGELSAALALRCERLLVSDGAEGAVKLARQRLRELPHVEVRQAWLPDDWPAQSFDLIVISELGYYFEPAALRALATRARASLAPGGTVLACHWRRPVDGCTLDGDGVNDTLAQALALPRLCQILDEDFRIDVWCDDERSVAVRENLA